MFRPLARPSAAMLTLVAGHAVAQVQGPSSSEVPYVVPAAAGVVTKSILTVGDSIGGYRMAGLADGMGAVDNGDGTMTVYMNHEIPDSAGVVRAHGGTGSFVSQWTIDKVTHQVLSGSDLIHTAFAYDKGAGAWTLSPAERFNRFCSADLAGAGAYFNPRTGRGTLDRIFLTGEETRPPFSADHGRAWATPVSGSHAGSSYELPRLGRMAWENAVASPWRQDKTIVIGLDDADANTNPGVAPSELYIYVGKKTNSANPIEAAGLHNGNLFGMKVSVGGSTVTQESNAFGLGSASLEKKGDVSLFNFGDVSGISGVDLQTQSIANDLLRMQRIEDGQFDPRGKFRNDFYFVTTASFSSNSRLWRLRFDDIAHPELGGELEMLLEGPEGHKMLDNMTMDRFGNILMQEDPGGQDHLAKIWNYNVASDSLSLIATHNPTFFDPNLLGPGLPGPDFLTKDEESSGIVDAYDLLGPGWFLLDDQAHYGIGDPELVEGGQMLALFNPASVPAPASSALVALAGLTAARRRR